MKMHDPDSVLMKSIKADFHEANISLRIRSETILRMRCEVCDIVEKSPRILEEIHILARTFKDGVCSKLAYTEKEATAFEATAFEATASLSKADDS